MHTLQLDKPLTIRVEEPVSGQHADFDLYLLHAATVQALSAGSDEAALRSLSEYLNSRFPMPVAFAENQLRQVAESVLAFAAQHEDERKKKASAFASWLLSTLAYPATSPTGPTALSPNGSATCRP